MNDFIFQGAGSWMPLLSWHVLQVTIVAMVVWPLARCAAKRNAHVSHLLWALVLIKCVTPPVIAAPTSPFCWISQSNEAVGVVEMPVQDPVSKPVSKPVLSVATRAKPLPDKQPDKLPKTPIVSQTLSATEVDANGVARPQASSFEVAQKSGDVGLGRSSLLDRFLQPQLGWMVALGIWISGAAVAFLIAGWRMRQLHIEIGRGKSSDSVQQLVEVLRRKLGVRQQVRVRVLSSALGPAVTGFFRPTVLLPQSIVELLDQDELELVIAHELIHFRRGDLGWAVLQSVCSCLFWFHPLVRLAVRELTVQSERCCDEQTIAGLRCSSAQYAKGLLSVLECKVRLQAIPALPGVRTVDITSKRLERIMNFKDEMKTRTPLLAWLVLVVGGLIALPGAAWVVAQDSGVTNSAPQDTQVTRRRVKVGDEAATIEIQGIVPPTSCSIDLDGPVGEIPFVVRAYDVAGLKKRFAADMLAEGCSRTNLAPADLQILPGGSAPPEERTMKAIFNGQVPEGLPETVKLGGDEPLAKLIGDFLFLLYPEAMQEDIRRRLDSVREFGFRQILYRASFASVSKEILEAQKLKWSLLEADGTFVVPAETSANHQPTWLLDNSTLDSSVHGGGTQHYVPIYVAEVNGDRIERFKSTLKKLSTGPSGTTFGGCPATFQHKIFQRPFVVGVKRNKEDQSSYDPVIKLFEVGTKLTVQGKHSGGDAVSLTCKLRHSSVVDVGVQEGLIDVGVQVQVPKLDTLNIDFDYQLPHGRGLVVATPIEPASDRFRVLFLDCEALVLKNEIARHQPAGLVSHQSDVNPFDRPMTPKPKKLKISTSGRAGELKPDSWAVKAILKESGFEAEVNGHLEMKLNAGTVELSGKDMAIEIENEKYSADAGTIKFANKQLASVELIGEVKLGLYGTPLRADKVQLVGRTKELERYGPFYSRPFSSMNLSGSVSINAIEDQEGMALSADKVELKDNGIFLNGNAKMELFYDGLRQVYSGDSVCMNDAIEQFEIEGKGTLVFEKGVLKKTWKGEKVRMSAYGKGLMVDGELQDYSEFLTDQQ